jgi:hypothetical protein
MARQITERRFTDEQVEAANNAPVLDYIQRAGYSAVRHGNKYFRLKEMDSLVIDPAKNNWHRYSEDVGGNAVTFVMYFEKLSFPDAVRKLLKIYHPELLPKEQRERTSVRTKVKAARKMLGLDKDPAQKEPPTVEANKEALASAVSKDDKEVAAVPQPVSFTLPPRNINNNRVMAYLCQSRGIDGQVVIDCLRKKTIYEDAEHHNVVFVGFDKANNAMYAGLRGTYTKDGQASFKGEVEGSNKAFSWAYTPSKPSETLFVYESPIDAMSHMTLHKMDGKDYKAANRLSLGTVSYLPLEQYLADHPEIKRVGFCLDNDLAGRRKTQEFMASLKNKGYVCNDWYVPDTMTLCTFKNFSRVEAFLNKHPEIRNISIQLKSVADRQAADTITGKLQAKGYTVFKENKDPNRAKDINEKLQLLIKKNKVRDKEFTR